MNLEDVVLSKRNQTQKARMECLKKFQSLDADWCLSGGTRGKGWGVTDNGYLTEW